MFTNFLGLTTVFIKFWGQNEISGKCHCSETVAGTVAIRLTGYKIRKTGYGAASFHCESGLPDSKSGRPDRQNFWILPQRSEKSGLPDTKSGRPDSPEMWVTASFRAQTIKTPIQLILKLSNTLQQARTKSTCDILGLQLVKQKIHWIIHCSSSLIINSLSELYCNLYFFTSFVRTWVCETLGGRDWEIISSL